MLRAGCALLVLTMLGLSPEVTTAQHFRHCVSRTGANATIVLPDTLHVRSDGVTLEPGDELAVLADNGVCVGSVTWEGTRTAFPIWGDDVFTEAKDGLNEDDAVHLRYWDASSQREYDATMELGGAWPYLRTRSRYAPDAIFLIRTLVLTDPASSDVSTASVHE